MKPGSRRGVLIGAGAVVAALLALLWAFWPRPLAVELATATRGPFETSIDDDARTRLRDRYVVSAPLAGRLARITLREGDAVGAGQPVAVLTPALAPLHDERTARELAARVDVAQALLQRAATRIEGARIGLRKAEADLARTEPLAAQGFVAATRLDADRLAAQAARAELDAARAEQRVASHELEQARAAHDVARRPGGGGAAFTLRAPVAGRVLRIAQPSEASVTLGTPLLEIGDTTRLEVVAELLTADALQAAPGRRVVIERWGGPAALEGRVRRVEPSAFTKVSALGVEEQRVNVLIDIVSPPADWGELGDGWRVGVRVVTLSLGDALRVPSSAVFALPAADDGHEMAVFAVRDGRARLTPVDVGARNGRDAWIRSGLDTGAAVVVYPPAGLVDGARVAPR